MHLIRAVLAEDRPVGLLTDDAEDRAGAPVGQMMIAGAELDRAKIGQDDRTVVRIGLNDALRDPAMDVEPRQDPDDELSEEARHTVKQVHAVGRAVDLFFIPAVKDLVAQLLVDRVERAVVLSVDDRQRLCGLVGKLLLHDKRRRNLVALIEVLVCDEPVHLGPQRDGLDECRHDDMEHGVAELRLICVLPLQIGVHVGQIDGLGDVRLVVAAVRIDQRGDEVHPIQIAQQTSVLAVAKPLLLFFHKIHTP